MKRYKGMDKGNKGKEIIIPATKGKGGICFGPHALGESVCGVPKKGYFYAPYIPLFVENAKELKRIWQQIMKDVRRQEIFKDVEE